MKTRLWTYAALCAALSMSGAARADLLALFENEKVNEPYPSILLDSSGNGNHAVMSGEDMLTDDGQNGGGLQVRNPGGSITRINTPGSLGAFESITNNQAATIAFWVAGGSTAGVRNEDDTISGVGNTSAFWMVAPDNNGTGRGFQAHLPWSNQNVYVDIGGCCSGTQRVNDVIDRSLWAADEGEEWTHWAFVLEPQFGDVAVYIDGVYEPLLERLGPTDFIADITSFVIGADGNGGNRMDARFDDFVIADEALSEGQVQTLINDGPSGIWETVDPDFYEPTIFVDSGLSASNGADGGQLVGYVNGLEGAAVESWSIAQIFETTIMVDGEPKTLTTMLDLSGEEGFSGTEAVGSPESPVQFGHLDLAQGADPNTYKFQLTSTTDLGDPVLGVGVASTQQFEILVDGTGGGGPCNSIQELGDINCDGAVDLVDFNILKENFGTVEGVPEPSTLALLAGAGCFALVVGRRRR